MRTHTARLAAALALATALLAGCSSGGGEPAPTPEPAKPTTSVAETERCYGTADAEGPDYATGVDCEEAHGAEVFAVLDMPANATSEERSDYTGETPVRAEWQKWAEDTCEAQLGEVTGVNRLAVNARLAPNSSLPAIIGNYSYSLTPVDEWDEGIRKTVCTYQFAAEVPEQAGYALEAYMAEEFPVALRTCYSPTNDVVGCGTPHLSEAGFVFDAEENLGSEYVATVNPQDVADEAWVRFDAYCAAAEAGLLQGSREDVGTRSDIVTGQWDPAAGRYQVTCLLQALPEDGEDEVPLLTESVVALGEGTLPVVGATPTPSPTS